MSNENDASRAASHARVVARTDGGGELIALEAGERAKEGEARLALSVDLVAAALARLGETRAAGRLRSALVVFEGAVVAIGRDRDDRNVVVIGDGEARQGLVLSHLHRMLEQRDREER
jgi:hypothetical protein